MDKVGLDSKKATPRYEPNENYIFYWIVVFDQLLGDFYNITLLEDENSNLHDICKRFEKKNPKYLVAKAGVGIQTRPPEIKKLPYLFYYHL
ncbi:hypothetical protein AWH56_010810 [Anaerobacillus isosaccharinicus]|uniref:Uncharacterized protein n=1 Tax=Anaerobacillus isosaccharinicus TaxID=1532552 RepID=A0A1S2MDB1_9BACI|nr:hypothetical protein [Anaerobacillus isosaccharinicus]MBA5588580.1 hypothetical protein [Anaerobacillus isosaccharinicus]QOY38005.1 hypothetical protein AWH56_010810 [Anaerobacillus isosaccharinicus]